MLQLRVEGALPLEVVAVGVEGPDAILPVVSEDGGSPEEGIAGWGVHGPEGVGWVGGAVSGYEDVHALGCCFWGVSLVLVVGALVRL